MFNQERQNCRELRAGLAGVAPTPSSLCCRFRLSCASCFCPPRPGLWSGQTGASERSEPWCLLGGQSLPTLPIYSTIMSWGLLGRGPKAGSRTQRRPRTRPPAQGPPCHVLCACFRALHAPLSVRVPHCPCHREVTIKRIFLLVLIPEDFVGVVRGPRKTGPHPPGHRHRP